MNCFPSCVRYNTRLKGSTQGKTGKFLVRNMEIAIGNDVHSSDFSLKKKNAASCGCFINVFTYLLPQRMMGESLSTYTPAK